MRRMSVKVKPVAMRTEGETPTPSEIQEDFDSIDQAAADDARSQRRSLQVSIPDPQMRIVIGILAVIVRESYSQIFRSVIEPYLQVVFEILKEEGLLNEFGNVSTDPAEIQKAIRRNSRYWLKKFIIKAQSRKIDVSWISTTSLF